MATPTEKIARYERKAERQREDEKRMFGTLVRGGTAATTGFVTGYLLEYQPRLRSFDKKGKVPTRPIIAAVTFLGALGLDSDDGGDFFEGLTMGIGIPWTASGGARARRAQKAAADEDKAEDK